MLVYNYEFTFASVLYVFKYSLISVSSYELIHFSACYTPDDSWLESHFSLYWLSLVVCFTWLKFVWNSSVKSFMQYCKSLHLAEGHKYYTKQFILGIYAHTLYESCTFVCQLSVNYSSSNSVNRNSFTYVC